ncbi:MAG: hypothetical protein ACU0CO_05505 [Shimia sp.]
MTRIVGQAVLLALAFYAGIRFEATDAHPSCRGAADWPAYLECVAGEIL